MADAVVPLVEAAPDVDPAGVDAGDGVGNEVNGVGSGGSGWARIPAIISFMPESVPLCRYLYH